MPGVNDRSSVGNKLTTSKPLTAVVKSEVPSAVSSAIFLASSGP
jgi:hypothetical protein